jgi:hypothetical protein
MQLKDIMTPEVERLPKDTSIHDVAQKMKALDVGMIPVGSVAKLLITFCYLQSVVFFTFRQALLHNSGCH